MQNSDSDTVDDASHASLTAYRALAGATRSSDALFDQKMLIKFKDLEMGEEIGRGAFGVVMLGEFSGNKCVIKQLKTSDDRARNDLIREGAQLAQLRNHASITTFYGMCLNPLCLVTEYIAGGNLGSYLADDRNRLTGSDVLNLAKDLAGGLQVLHASNMLHLDISARNMLVLTHETPLKLRIAEYVFVLFFGSMCAFC
jgi:serine/threonine protein kinase